MHLHWTTLRLDQMLLPCSRRDCLDWTTVLISMDRRLPAQVGSCRRSPLDAVPGTQSCQKKGAAGLSCRSAAAQGPAASFRWPAARPLPCPCQQLLCQPLMARPSPHPCRRSCRQAWGWGLAPFCARSRLRQRPAAIPAISSSSP